MQQGSLWDRGRDCLEIWCRVRSSDAVTLKLQRACGAEDVPGRVASITRTIALSALCKSTNNYTELFLA
jgi:hypothetical protein